MISRKAGKAITRAIQDSCEFQQLENRMMLSATPLKVVLSKGMLSVTGSTLNDQITVSYASSIWTITNDEWSVTKTGTATKLSINAGKGDDTVTIDSSVTIPTTLIGDLGNDALIAASGASSLNGGAGNDTLIGGDAADKLYGAAGDDSLDGGAGDDLLQGGLGSDILTLGSGNNTLDFSDHKILEGMTFDLGAGTATRLGESDSFSGTIAIFNATQGHDSITGTEDADAIFGLGGNDTINGLGGNDTLKGGAGNDLIDAGEGADKIYDEAGNDSVSGGDGDDSLYGGAGNDTVSGDAGADLILTLGGGTLDSVSGGEGYDIFWVDEAVTDASAEETAAGTVHTVTKFNNFKSKELGAGKIADPKLTSSTFKYRSFSDRALFAADGPSDDDISQGQVGDCYFLATISSIAKINPELIRQSIVDLGDGTFAVQFAKNGVKQYVRVDNDLPTYSWSTTTLAYASWGEEGSMWAPLMEKAFAYFRKGQNTYASISSGLMSEVYNAFGTTSTNLFASSYNANSYASAIKDLLDAGKSVTAACYVNPAGANMVTGHAYTVDSVIDNGDGTYSVRVRNPWGVDAYSSTDGANDGYVTLTAAQAFVGISLIQAASV